jgi:hypothetical protein
MDYLHFDFNINFKEVIRKYRASEVFSSKEKLVANSRASLILENDFLADAATIIKSNILQKRLLTFFKY